MSYVLQQELGSKEKMVLPLLANYPWMKPVVSLEDMAEFDHWSWNSMMNNQGWENSSNILES